MSRLSFLADEHVPSVVGTALRSNGYTVVVVTDRYGERTVDSELLADATRDGLVLLTNDRDFVVHAEEIDHVGVIIYTNRTVSPGTFVRGIDRIDHYFDPGSMRNNVEWLEEWLD